MGFDGRVVLITGASSGIGAALAVGYAKEGARVAITYRANREGAEATAQAAAAEGGEVLVLPFDLGAPEEAPALVEAVKERWGGLDNMVANAVRWPSRGGGRGFEALARDSWTSGLRTNLEGTFALTQAAVQTMRTAGWGRILFMSSGLAEEGMAGAETYTTAKAALHGLARSLAWGVGGDGILVNVLAGGLTLTERNRASLPREVQDSVASRAPLRRLSEPHELVAPVLFLTSAANTSITGEIVREGSSTGRSGHAA